MKFEDGLDLNFDGHCDLCGKFVDSYGHHRATKVFDLQQESMKQSFLEADGYFDEWDSMQICNRYFVKNPYINKGLFYGSRFWYDVKNYTSPEIFDWKSGISINKYLRDGRIPSDCTWEEIYKKAIQINIAIDDFEIKTPFITYRGFSIPKGSSLCSMLDEGYKKLLNNQTFIISDKGFVSSSLSLDYAKYRMQMGDGDAHICMSIVLNEGQHAMPLIKKYGTTFNDSEREVLMKYNQDFEIVSMERYKKGKDYYYNLIAILKGDHEYDN